MKGLNRDTKGNVGEFMIGGCPKLGRLLLVDLIRNVTRWGQRWYIHGHLSHICI